MLIRLSCIVLVLKIDILMWLLLRQFISKPVIVQVCHRFLFEFYPKITLSVLFSLSLSLSFLASLRYATHKNDKTQRLGYDNYLSLYKHSFRLAWFCVWVCVCIDVCVFCVWYNATDLDFDCGFNYYFLFMVVFQRIPATFSPHKTAIKITLRYIPLNCR